MLRSGKVLTPPDEDETDSQLEALEEKGKLSPVDVLGMIESWNTISENPGSRDTLDPSNQKQNTPKSALKTRSPICSSKSKQSTALSTVEITSHGSNPALDITDGMDHLLVDQSIRSQIHRKALFKRMSDGIDLPWEPCIKFFCLLTNFRIVNKVFCRMKTWY